MRLEEVLKGPSLVQEQKLSEAKRGRPTVYKTEFAGQALKLCKLGATDADLAEFFGVTDRTINRWQIRYDEFCRSLKDGKEAADNRVERSLYHKAVGYTFDAEKIFQYEGAPVRVPYREHIAPDTTAMIFWLKNRRAADWRDKREITGDGGGPLQVVISGDDANLL